MKPNYQKTIYACFVGYIVQAVVNNFVPLLFLTFQSSYGIPRSQITLLVTFNFGVQLLIDFLSAYFVDKIGYRVSIVLAHVFSAVGLVALAILPEIMENHFAGLLLAVTIYAIGGGLIEVLISPIMESCPSDNKEAAMSLLHSFYCWGHVFVVLTSTAFFYFVGIEHWRILAVLWAALPVVNGIVFLRTPMTSLIAEGETGLTIPQLARSKIFWILMVMMLCAGASEQAVSQWASTFAEQGLGVSKTLGDLAGPMSFAILMGASRAWYGKRGDKLDLDQFMKGSCILCVCAYLCIVFVPNAVVGLLGCAVTGLSVGIMWPGTFSKATVSIRNGGTAMFALLALAGDLGCGGGPTLAGMVSGAFGDDLHIGILAAIIFPVGLLVTLHFLRREVTPKRG